jgi:hypothetical protein
MHLLARYGEHPVLRSVADTNWDSTGETKTKGEKRLIFSAGLRVGRILQTGGWAVS